jgi:hypothetical protein
MADLMAPVFAHTAIGWPKGARLALSTGMRDLSLQDSKR